MPAEPTNGLCPPGESRVVKTRQGKVTVGIAGHRVVIGPPYNVSLCIEDAIALGEALRDCGQVAARTVRQ
jgi:hypothetical protein